MNAGQGQTVGGRKPDPEAWASLGPQRRERRWFGAGDNVIRAVLQRPNLAVVRGQDLRGDSEQFNPSEGIVEYS